MLVWRKLASAKWEDAWAERLACVHPTRLVMKTFASGKSVRIEAWDIPRPLGEMLLRQFGGTLSEIRSANWAASAKPRKPLRIRGLLDIVADPAAAPKTATLRLVIPAEMAFGTGDHATTAACLRYLADRIRSGTIRSALDAGCGSGILALAASQLGVPVVEGFDFDPTAVRIARKNARRNGLDRVRFTRRNVLAWSARRRFDLVLANLFSEVLIAAAPRLVAALAPRGRLIISGVLRDQLPQTLAAFDKLGLVSARSSARGKWAAAELARPD